MLFDHLVSVEQGHRHVSADRRRGLEIDHEFGVARGLCIRRAAEVN